MNTLNDASAEVSIIGITESARELVLNYRSQSDKPNPDRLGMWLEITGVSGDGFSYDMYLKSVDEAATTTRRAGLRGARTAVEAAE